jgi:hypothetical protein
LSSSSGTDSLKACSGTRMPYAHDGIWLGFTKQGL